MNERNENCIIYLIIRKSLLYPHILPHKFKSDVLSLVFLTFFVKVASISELTLYSLTTIAVLIGLCQMRR